MSPALKITTGFLALALSGASFASVDVDSVPSQDVRDTALDRQFCEIPAEDRKDQKTLYGHSPKKKLRLWHVGKNRWNPEEEMIFQNWISQIDKAIFGPLGIGMDCADATIALRMIYAKWRHLPFMAIYLTHRKQRINILSHASGVAAGKKYPFIPHWKASNDEELIQEVKKDRRFLVSLKVLLETISTFDIGLSTFPLKVFEKIDPTMEPKDFRLNPAYGLALGQPITFGMSQSGPKRTRHTIFLHSVDSATGWASQMSKGGDINANPMAPGEAGLSALLFLKGETKGRKPGVNREGFHAWRWPVYCGGKWRFVSKNMQPGYDLDWEMHKLQQAWWKELGGPDYDKESKKVTGRYDFDMGRSKSPTQKMYERLTEAWVTAARRYVNAPLEIQMSAHKRWLLHFSTVIPFLSSRYNFVTQDIPENSPSTDTKIVRWYRKTLEMIEVRGPLISIKHAVEKDLKEYIYDTGGCKVPLSYFLENLNASFPASLPPSPEDLPAYSLDRWKKNHFVSKETRGICPTGT